MNEDDKPSQEIEFKDRNESNDFNDFNFDELKIFYKEVNDAIRTHNMQSLYGLSKIFTRYCVKKLNL
jgi:hypothetical protein